MEEKYYSIFSPSSKSIVVSSVRVVDVTQEPLFALKLVVDGLTAHTGNGVWLGPFEQIPKVQGFARYDLVFLDLSLRALHLVTIRPGDEFPYCEGEPASLLLLPQGSLEEAGVQVNETLVFYVPDGPGAPPPPALVSAAAAQTAKAQARGLSGVYKPTNGGAVGKIPAGPNAKPTGVKEPPLKRFLRWIDPTLVSQPELRISLRRPSPALVAYRWDKGVPRDYRIGDISSTGVYLLTHEYWQDGEKVNLFLQREGPPEENPLYRVEIEAEVVRKGREGVGLRFLLPMGMDLHLWEAMHESGRDMSGPEYVVSEMRYAEAVAFLRQISPTGSEALNQLMEKELGVARLKCAVDIAHLTKDILTEKLKKGSHFAHPGVVLRILENGSWAEFDLIKGYWAGLLASACTPTGNDVSNLQHVDSFSLMRVTHFLLLAEGCKLVDAGEDPACSPEELQKITGKADMTPIYRAIALLGELGLMEKMDKSTYSFGEKVAIAPTTMGWQLMARCHGMRVTVK
jgi:hypothetical protein